jgi:3-oxoacyl-[acyl-carrier protein] reductase
MVISTGGIARSLTDIARRRRTCFQAFMSVKMELDLTGKVALITGASRGIGREAAIRMAAAGARVAVNYSSSAREAEEVVAQIGGDAIAVQADVGNPAEVERMVERTIRQFGRIDIVVNNAATYEENLFERDDYDAWQRGWRHTFEVNVFGAANVAFLAMRSMRRSGGGKIINVSSRSAFRGETDAADYGASKAALVNLTRTMARACAKDNIVSSCVTPGFIDTEMARQSLEKDRAAIEAQIPLGRVGTVDDVAAVILFLASPLANYLNGVTIDVNGGSWFH